CVAPPSAHHRLNSSPDEFYTVELSAPECGARLRGVGAMRRVFGAVVAGVVVAVCLVGSLLFALHKPVPHQVPVGLVAPDPVAAQVGSALAAHAPDAFALSRYGDAAAAESAVRDGDVTGAFVADQAGPRLLVASANGPINRQVLEAAFSPVAQQSGATLTVQ